MENEPEIVVAENGDVFQRIPGKKNLWTIIEANHPLSTGPGGRFQGYQPFLSCRWSDHLAGKGRLLPQVQFRTGRVHPSSECCGEKPKGLTLSTREMFHLTQQGSSKPDRFEALQSIKAWILDQNFGGQPAQGGRLIFAT